MGVEILTLLLSAGGVAMVTALVQAYRALRSGAAADEKDHIETAEDRRRVAEIDRDHAITVANYWRQRAGILEYHLNKVNPEVLNSIIFPAPPEMAYEELNGHGAKAPEVK